MTFCVDAGALNWMSLLGMVLLAYPALSLDRRKRDLDRVERILSDRSGRDSAGLLAELGASVQQRRSSAVARWRWVDRGSLWTGYFLLLASMAARAFGWEC